MSEKQLRFHVDDRAKPTEVEKLNMYLYDTGKQKKSNKNKQKLWRIKLKKDTYRKNKP